MSIARTPLEVRFWRMVDNSGDGCWLWRGAKKEFGHGVINAGGRGRALRAHRVSWELHFGEIPAGLLVCHKCDVPSCVNPEHLFLGTNADNMADCARKGRYDKVKRPRGAKHGMSRLTEDDVRAIRIIHAELRPSYKSIAEEFGVSLQQVFRIVTGESWRHLL